MSKHTPGPWEFEEISDAGDERGEGFIIGGNLGGLVGAALPWPTELDSGDFSRVEANARLIAAAPDLLEALKKAVEYLRPRVPGGKRGVVLLPELEAAIAKAEGSV